MKDFDSALEDATKTTEIKPDWAKGWGRKGTALHGVGNLGEWILYSALDYADCPQSMQ